MTNGPHAAYYARRIKKECPHISLGQDINLVSGRPLSDKNELARKATAEARIKATEAGKKLVNASA